MKLTSLLVASLALTASLQAEVIVWFGPGKLIAKNSAKTTSLKTEVSIVTDVGTAVTSVVFAVTRPASNNQPAVKAVAVTTLPNVGKVETKTGNVSSMLFFGTKVTSFNDGTDFQQSVAKFAGKLANVALHKEFSATTSIPKVVSGSVLDVNDNGTNESTFLARFSMSATYNANTNNLSAPAAADVIKDYYVSKGYTAAP